VNDLPAYLADMADEVTTPADMRDRVLASSRRTTIRRRALLAGSAAAAVVMIVSGVAWAGLPGRGTGKQEVATSPAPGRTTTTQSPQPQASAPPPPPAVPTTLFYLSADGRLLDRNGTTLFTPDPYACGLTVSRDGARIAYVDTDGSGPTGDLVVANLDGSAKKTVLGDVACTGGTGPLWLHDDASLMVRQRNTGPRVTVRIASGRTEPNDFADVQGNLVTSPWGILGAYEEDGDIVVARGDGSVLRRQPHGDETPTGGFSVQGVNEDGTQVVVGMNNTDPDFVRTGFRLVDMMTGRNVGLPASISVSNPKQVSIHMISGADLLVRSDGVLYRVDFTSRVVDRRTEPAGLDDAALIWAG
jgi:hypothetical protein